MSAARPDLPVPEDDERASGGRLLHVALYVLLALVFLTGGSSQQRGWSDASVQMLALPVLALAAWRVAALGPSRVRLLGVASMAAIALLPWLQLLPLPEPLWRLAPARAALARDLSLVGVFHPAMTWSLTPSATLRSALSLLPALALFGGALCTGTPTQRRLLAACVLLPIASLVLGFLQMGAAQDSMLNPYPQWAPAMGGVFANPNHQGTAMLVGLGICLAHVFGGFGVPGDHDMPGRRRRALRWPAVIAGGTLLLGLPLTNSRAVVIIGVFMLFAAPLAIISSTLRRMGKGRGSLFALALIAVTVAAGLAAVTAWMRVDEIQGLRWIMRQATMSLAWQHLPWGSGIGSFVPVFEQAMPMALLRNEYINAAHNDFAQVWLEAGIAGLLIAGLLVTACVCALRASRREGVADRRLVWSALLGMFPLVAHAYTDFALRTPALMAVAALLFGVLVAQGARSR
jgi:O-antigen ligase